MKTETMSVARPRVAFLLILAAAISIVFYWMIRDFLLALLVAAVLAAMVHPFYGRVLQWVKGRKALASGLTVLFSLVLVIVPLLLFAAVLVGQALDVSQTAEAWFTQQIQQPEALRKQLTEDPDLKQLLPYQDQILARAGQIAEKVGAFVAEKLAAGAASTASFLLMLFVMLFAMFTFLIDGKELLEGVLRFTPLSAEEKQRLLGTFVSVGRATLKGTLIIGIVQGSLAALSFWVAGIGGVVFWGVMMAVLSIIPGIGAALIWVPAVIYLFMKGQAGAAVGVGLWCAIVVGTIDNLLRPLLIGKDTEMPDLLVMLTTLGGLALFGAAGMLVGPIIGALYMTIWKLWGSAMDMPDGAADAKPLNRDPGDATLNTRG
jgi:predicted PurR-regulated permease PerM